MSQKLGTNAILEEDTMRTRTNPRPNHDEGSRTTRVMAHLRDSLVSELKKLDPSLSLHARHSSLIERRLGDLFPAFHTPTHPPYALMIRSAILGLEDETGSTEEAISEFIKKEYSDLPWAHGRILGLQLEKLCEIGEIACVAGWRYVLKVEDEVKEQCEGSDKKKRVKRRSNKRGEEESAEEECKKGRVLELGKQCQQQVEPQRGIVESQNQDSRLHLETTCSSQPTTLNCISIANLLSPAELQLERSFNGTSTSNAVGKISGSLSLNVEVYKPDETKIGVHHHQSRDREPSGFKQIADHEGESLLPSCDITLAKQEPNEEKTDEGCPSQLQGRESIYQRDQVEYLMCSSHSNQKEFREAPKFGQQLSVPTSEWYPEGTVSAEIKLPPTHSDIDLTRFSKRKASTLENVQYYNEGSSKGNLDEEEHRPLKRPRGRPRKTSLLPSDDDNLHQLKPNINEMKKQYQYSGGRGLGRFGQGRGRGRPPTLNRKTNQCDEQLQEAQSKPLGRGRGRGCRGRPPKLNENENQPQQKHQDQQAKEQHVRARGSGRPPKPNHHTNQFEDQLQSQNQTEDLLNSPSLEKNDIQSLEPVKRHESESGEIQSPAKLRQELESKNGFDEAFRSNIEENDNPWRLMPVQGKAQGIDGCWPLRQYQK